MSSLRSQANKGMALLGLLLASAAVAKEDLATLFPSEAELSINRPGLSRLQLPVEVLSACQPDLSDLRIFGADGTEVAYLVDRGSLEPATAELRQRQAAEIVGAEKNERGEQPVTFEERYQLTAPKDSSTVSWDLVLESPRPELVRKLEVQVDGKELLSESVFRLRRASAERLQVTLPRFTPSNGRLTVILRGERTRASSSRASASRRHRRSRPGAAGAKSIFRPSRNDEKRAGR
jgi:hypothetical protein